MKGLALAGDTTLVRSQYAASGSRTNHLARSRSGESLAADWRPYSHRGWREVRLVRGWSWVLLMQQVGGSESSQYDFEQGDVAAAHDDNVQLVLDLFPAIRVPFVLFPLLDASLVVSRGSLDPSPVNLALAPC